MCPPGEGAPDFGEAFDCDHRDWISPASLDRGLDLTIGVRFFLSRRKFDPSLPLLSPAEIVSGMDRTTYGNQDKRFADFPIFL